MHSQSLFLSLLLNLNLLPSQCLNPSSRCLNLSQSQFRSLSLSQSLSQSRNHSQSLRLSQHRNRHRNQHRNLNHSSRR